MTRGTAQILRSPADHIYRITIRTCSVERGEPAKAKSLTAFRLDFHRDLIGRAADTLCLDFQHGHDVVHRGPERFQRGFAGLLFDLLKCAVNDLLGYAALAVQHDVVDQLCDNDIVVNRISQHFSFLGMSFSRHVASLLN